MSESTNMDIDIVIKNVKELQKERSCLESKLKELRSKRVWFENKVENLSQRFGQVKDVHAKMSETLKVAQHKVAHTQSQIDSQEELNSEHARAVKDCEKELNLELDNQRAKLTNFQERLEDVANRMLDANKFYSDSNIKKVIAETTKELRASETEAVHSEKETEHLLKTLQDMENGEDELRLEVPVEEQKAILGMAGEENRELQASVDALLKKKEGLQKIFLELDD